MQNIFQPYQFQPNILPQQQITQVNGKASIDTIQMAPNSSVLLLDNTSPIVWMCMSDGVGRVTSIPYDITEHVEKKPVDELEIRLTNIENTLKELKNNYESKSNATKPEYKQNEPKSEQYKKHDGQGKNSQQS